MDRIEFNEVVNRIRSRFERVDNWFRKLEAEKRAAPVLDAWWEILRGVDKLPALSAIHDILLDENKPRTTEEYALRVRKIALSKKTKKTFSPGGEPTYECKFCQDRRHVVCFTPNRILDHRLPRSGKTILDFYGPKATWMRVAMLCICSGADQANPAVFRPDEDIPWTLEEERRRREEAGEILPPPHDSSITEDKPLPPKPLSVEESVKKITEVAQELDRLAERDMDEPPIEEQEQSEAKVRREHLVENAMDAAQETEPSEAKPSVRKKAF